MKSPLIFLLGLLDLLAGALAILTITTSSLREISIVLLFLLTLKGLWTLITSL